MYFQFSNLMSPGGRMMRVLIDITNGQHLENDCVALTGARRGIAILCKIGIAS